MPIIQRQPRKRPDLDLAPMIDVVFLLLIFFMLAGSFATPHAIDLALPEGGAPKEGVVVPLRIVVDADGRYSLNDRTISLEDLPARIQTAREVDPELPVRLEMDRTLNVQQLIKTLDRLRSVGIHDLDIATSPAGQ